MAGSLAHVQVKSEARQGALGSLGVSAAGGAAMGGQKEPERLETTLAWQTCLEATHVSKVFSKLSPRHPSPAPRGLSVRTRTFVGVPGPTKPCGNSQSTHLAQQRGHD